MTRWQWQLRQLAVKLGWPGLAGVALLLSGIVVLLVMVQPGQARIASLEGELSSLRSNPQIGRQYAPEEELALFYDFFPKQDTLTEQLRTLHTLAAEHGIEAPSVDYKLSRVSGTPLWRYQASMPLIIDYATLRHFLAAVLQTLPNAALEDIELQRPDADTDVIDAKISLTIYYREAP